ncbi:Wadjet anti-phage system protein JetD domain-containing protein [Kitasatospora griseola]|uniref:Wadjet anti-phage system protein JetD domain-containing protein n=1 Tax=Kitasatospora griseola TaxID=2064 RepID=UPI00341B5759
MPDSSGLAAADRRYLEALRTRATAGKRKSVAWRRLAITVVKEIHHDLFGPAPEGALTPRVVGEALTRIRATGEIDFTASTDQERVGLPVHIKVREHPLPAVRRPAMPPLHPELSRVAAEWSLSRRRPEHLAAYIAVNEWLIGRPDLTQLPMCERSLEIFGKPSHLPYFPEPEKALTKLSFGWLFSDRMRLRELLHLVRAEPPLLNEWYPSRPRERGFTRMERGDTLFVVENYTTCWSLARALEPLDHGLGYLAWGIGKSFSSSICSIRPDHGVGAIRYFGDIDASGLAIPQRAQEQAERADLPPVEPAESLYDALFELGVPLPGAEEPVTPEKAHELAAWLPERHRGRAVEILIRGERLAQEWVNLHHLRGSSAWYADVG